MLIGTNHDEFTMFAGLRYLRLGRGVSSAEYPATLKDIFGADGRAVLAHYPPDRYGGDVSLAYSAAATDGTFACVADRIAGALSRRAPVYAYEFDDPHAPAPDPLRHVPFPVGSSHALELRYLFNVGGAPPLNPRQRVLSEQMIGYWSQFVTKGAPEAVLERCAAVRGGLARAVGNRCPVDMGPDGCRCRAPFASSVRYRDPVNT